MSIDRRAFLKWLGAGTGALMMRPWASSMVQAASKIDPDRRFIFCYFQGGWDLMLSLDARDPAGKYTGMVFEWDRIPSTYSKSLVQPKGSNIVFGPMMSGFARHYDVTTVVRGILMATVSHPVGRRYFNTGKFPRGGAANGSSVPVYLVSQMGDKATVPNLVMRVETFNEREPGYASGLKVSSSTAMISTFKDGVYAPRGAVRTLLERHRAAAGICDPEDRNAGGLLARVRASQQRARLMVSRNVGKYFDFFNRSDPDMVAIKSRYNIRSSTSGQAQAAVAFQAIRYNVAQAVSIEITRGLDTHGSTWATTQPQRLKEGFDTLGVLVDDLKRTPHPKGGTLMDKTTIVCWSEFGRTPKINARGGRDHFVWNAALLIGAGVPHNKVVGATSDAGMGGLAIDPNTGKPKTGGTIIKPEHVFASLMKAAGMRYDIFRQPALPALLPPGVTA